MFGDDGSNSSNSGAFAVSVESERVTQRERETKRDTWERKCAKFRWFRKLNGNAKRWHFWCLILCRVKCTRAIQRNHFDAIRRRRHRTASKLLASKPHQQSIENSFAQIEHTLCRSEHVPLNNMLCLLESLSLAFYLWSVGCVCVYLCIMFFMALFYKIYIYACVDTRTDTK